MFQALAWPLEYQNKWDLTLSLRMAASAGGARLLKRIMMQCFRRGAAGSEGEVGKSYPEVMLKDQLGEEGYSREGQERDQGWGEQCGVGGARRSRQERLAGASMHYVVPRLESGESSLNPLLSEHTNNDLRQANWPLGPQFSYLQNGIPLRFECNSSCKSLWVTHSKYSVSLAITVNCLSQPMYAQPLNHIDSSSFKCLYSCFLLSFPTAPILVKVTAKILTVVAASQLSLPQSKPLWAQFANLILLFLCLKLSQGSPLLTGQSLTSLGWQTRTFRSWPSSFLMRLVAASSFSGREVADCAWFSQVSGLGPCSETAPSSFMRFTAPHLWPPHPTVFLSWDLSGYSSPGQLFSSVVQQRLLSAGCKVPKAKD